MFEKILVPLDGSKLGEFVLPYVEILTSKLHSEITLLYVYESSEAEHLNVFQTYLNTIAQRVIETSAGLYGKPGPVKTDTLEGNPGEKILNYAEENNFSLIVMSSHARSGLKPWAVGSTALKITQQLVTPVLLIRANQSPDLRPDNLFARVLVPLDGSEKGEAALAYVAELAKHITTEVILLNVIASGQHVHTIGGLDYIIFPEQLMQQMKLEANKYLEKVCNRYPGGATFECQTRTGDATEEILKFCDERDISLVAMSSHGHSGIERWMLGSVSNKILQSGKVPLLLVKAR